MSGAKSRPEYIFCTFELEKTVLVKKKITGKFIWIWTDMGHMTKPPDRYLIPPTRCRSIVDARWRVPHAISIRGLIKCSVVQPQGNVTDKHDKNVADVYSL